MELNNDTFAKETYMAPSIAEFAFSSETILDVSGTSGEFGEGGNLELFGDDIIDIESIGTLF